MAVASTFGTSKLYIEEVVSFLKGWQWIYNYPNTHILVNKILEKVPVDWVLYLNELSNEDLNNLPFCQVNNNAPRSLKDFTAKLKSLKSAITPTASQEDAACLKTAKIGIKKVHEIVSLAPLIKTVCEKSHAGIVVDVGAGLGYLSELLHDKYKYKVIGIEGSKEKVRLAQINQEKNHRRSFVAYKEHYITSDSKETIEHMIDKTFPSECGTAVCITGLHACADLSITILDLFVQIERARSLVIMPCCYHRLQLEKVGDVSESFTNFPSSAVLKEVFCSHDGSSFLRRPFLRLACQQSSQSWRNMSERDHEIHAKNCLFRAILQAVADEENCKIKRLKRKSGQSANTDEYNIETFIDNVNSNYIFITCDGTELEIDDSIKKKILDEWVEQKDNLKLVEALAAFQAAIQSICENLVLLDRVEYLREKGLGSCVYKVTDDCLSPRCFALVASK